VLIVVHGMVLPQIPQAFRSLKAVDGIVHHGVQKVPIYKTCRENECRAPHQQEENAQKDGRNNDSGRWGHKEPVCVARIFVVVAVHHVVKTITRFGFIDKVEYVAVQNVFEKSPASESAEVHEQPRAQGVNTAKEAVEHQKTQHNGSIGNHRERCRT